VRQLRDLLPKGQTLPDESAPGLPGLALGARRHRPADRLGARRPHLRRLCRGALPLLRDDRRADALLDRGFIARLASGDDDPVLVRAILDMAHALGMVVVAEGIETEEQASVLRELGCERAQGYALARPAAAEVIFELVSPARAVPSSAPHR
jgi:hypothetical protein